MTGPEKDEQDGKKGRGWKYKTLGNGIPSPCYECGDRTATCHAECGKYKAFAAECDRIRKKRIEINSLYGPRDNGKEQIVKKRIMDRQRRGRR